MKYTWEMFCEYCEDVSIYSKARVENSIFITDPPAEDWITEWVGGNKHSILLHGNAGLGKTWCVFCLINRWINIAPRSPHSAKFVSCIDIQDRVEQNFAAYRSTKGVSDVLLDYSLLAIDDLGCESSGDMMERVLYRTINSRILRQLPTIISTNLSPEEMLNRYGARIYSRLKTYRWIEFVGEDLRSWR